MAIISLTSSGKIQAKIKEKMVNKGFWRLYQDCFSQIAYAILDFYWFELVRHQLRHGQSEQVLAGLAHEG